MSNQTQTDIDFAKKVREFMSRTNLSLFKVGKSINYTNTEKLKEVILEGNGSFSSRVMLRLENFMKSYKKPKP